VQFSLRLLESGYVRLVRPPQSVPVTVNRVADLRHKHGLSPLAGPPFGISLLHPLSLLRSPSPLPSINLPAPHRISFLRTARSALSSCFALCDLLGSPSDKYNSRLPSLSSRSCLNKISFLSASQFPRFRVSALLPKKYDYHAIAIMFSLLSLHAYLFQV